MLFYDAALIDAQYNLKEHMYLGTIGEKIAYLSDVPPQQPALYGETYSGKNRLLVPGFCNAHSHAAMILMRGYAENVPLMTWLNEHIFPFEAKLTAEDIYDATLLSAAESVRFGITASNDMYFFGESMARAFGDSGMKANVGVSLFCRAEGSYRDQPHYRALLEMKERFHESYGGRIRVAVTPHSEYGTTQRIAREMGEVALENQLPLHIHVAETRGETEACVARNGLSPVKYLDKCGLFNARVTAAHCVWVDEEDIAVLAEKGVTVATCPKSNLKLASGICPADKLLAAGVPVAIGTDSVASNNNLNLLEEMKIFAMIQKCAAGDAAAITPAQLLCASSRAGYLAQGREDCGLLATGFRADIAVFDTDKRYMKPENNLLNNLLYAACGNDVCLTMADGRVLYRDGEYPTMDIQRVQQRAEQSRRRILSELGAT